MSLEPGIYRATVRGVPDQIVMAHKASGGADNVCTIGKVEKWTMHGSSDITDARPLTVLDLGDNSPLVVRALTRAAEDPTNGFSRVIFRNLADQIEAQHAPPRIPEPGLWGVVEASSAPSSRYRTEFIHRSDTPDSHHWARVGDGDVFAWDDLIDPVLIRDGIEGQS